MGIPRDPIRIVHDGGVDKLVQPSTGIEWTEKMTRYSKFTLKKLTEIDGFILKSRSPSCGIKDVKLFAAKPNSPSLGKTSGIFAREVLDKYGHLAIEDEGRLTNYRIREHFLTKLYCLTDFRYLKKTAAMAKLVTFHANNKYLFMAYNQTAMREMGRIVANHDKEDINTILSNYESVLHRLFATLPRFTSHINTLQHIFGYFKKELTTAEKRHFDQLIDKYRNEKIPLSAVTTLLQSWVVRYAQQYLSEQTYFYPFPDTLVSVTDSGKGRP